MSGVKHLINNEIQCLSINIYKALSEGSDIASIHKIHKSLNNNRDKLKERSPNCETTLDLMLKIHSKLLDEKSHEIKLIKNMRDKTSAHSTNIEDIKNNGGLPNLENFKTVLDELIQWSIQASILLDSLDKPISQNHSLISKYINHSIPLMQKQIIHHLLQYDKKMNAILLSGN